MLLAHGCFSTIAEALNPKLQRNKCYHLPAGHFPRRFPAITGNNRKIKNFVGPQELFNMIGRA
jgi:hypothetical protein